MKNKILYQISKIYTTNWSIILMNVENFIGLILLSNLF